MPKIEATTVAEHRERRQQQVVSNAARLLTEGGLEAVTPAAVASATGLARSSVYQYFPTAAELVAAAVEEVFTVAVARMTEEVGPTTIDPWQRLERYARAAVKAAADGHDPARMAALSGLPEACLSRLRELHRQMGAPLRDIATAIGGSTRGAAQDGEPIPSTPVNVDVWVVMATGAVNTIPVLLEHGVSREQAAEYLLAFLRAALQAT